MAAGLSPYGEFMVLFNNLKKETKDTPKRVENFYQENRAIRRALDALEEFLSISDLERRVFHGPRKLFRQVPAEFEAAWKEFDAKWRFRRAPPPPPEPHSEIAINLQLDFLTEGEEEGEARSPPPEVPPPPEASPPSPGARRPYEYVEPQAPAGQREPEVPDPESEEFFDPIRHDGGAALKLGIDYLYDVGNYNRDGDLIERNSCWIGYQAYDYLVKTIGMNIPGIFSRWRAMPPIFMPAHVSNRYGASEKGSLSHLLDDAVRAYVFGAPAAAFAMCRAALEMILKQHYGEGEWENPKKKLAAVIALANERGLIKREEIKPLIDRADGILHRYTQESAISAEDERTILIFLKTLKSLIQQAPKR